MNQEQMIIRRIRPSDDPFIAAIVRANLERFHLDIPGTAYFDPELDHLSQYYQLSPGQRAYFILEDDKGQVAGGVGIAEFDGFEKCAELQKLYLTDAWKGKGYGSKLMETALEYARSAGYERVYLETHINLQTALCLYEKFGFQCLERPETAIHSTMDRFYLKELQEEIK
ncbi:GNAT family N-acetyltransferase [uncultured Desulfovibrio sp.]|uniref:GNAT family N-acetyltransferase n=1 Tax=uncultured Desulfovibrio sp. TaxID=167968 RepID=UPI002624FAAC|nr:GNAT family N-acetyltransferase [uncultured Desulfovibrio sp.]